MTQKNKKGKSNQQKGGGGPKAFISNPVTPGSVVLAKGSSDKKFKITVNVGQTWQTIRHSLACKIYANGQQVGGVQMVGTIRDIVLPEVELDPDKPVDLEIKQVGNNFADDQMQLRAPKSLTVAPKPAEKKPELVVRIDPVQGDGTCMAHIQIQNPQTGKAETDDVIVHLYQNANLNQQPHNGTDPPPEFPSNADGVVLVAIQITLRKGQVVFERKSSGYKTEPRLLLGKELA
jgi:hypothetical protein